MLDVRRLRVLLEVARHGSFTAAARTLSYTPSAVSQQIAALEREAGTTLVERGPRGVLLTEPGRVLAREADEILGRLASAELELQALAGLRAGLLRLRWVAPPGAPPVPPTPPPRRARPVRGRSRPVCPQAPRPRAGARAGLPVRAGAAGGARPRAGAAGRRSALHRPAGRSPAGLPAACQAGRPGRRALDPGRAARVHARGAAARLPPGRVRAEDRLPHGRPQRRRGPGRRRRRRRADPAAHGAGRARGHRRPAGGCQGAVAAGGGRPAAGGFPAARPPPPPWG